MNIVIGVCKGNTKSTFTKCVKVKVPCAFSTEHHAMKAYCGSGGIDPRTCFKSEIFERKNRHSYI